MSFIEAFLNDCYERFELHGFGARADLSWSLVARPYPGASYLMAIVRRGQGAQPVLALKIGRGERGAVALRREADLLHELHGAWPNGFAGAPRVLMCETFRRAQVLLTTAVPGEPVGARLLRRRPWECATALLAWLQELNGATRGPALDETYHGRLVEEAVAAVEAWCDGDPADSARVERTREQLAFLTTSDLPTVFEHGGLDGASLLVAPSGAVSAIHWERAERHGLPGHDLFSGLAGLAFLRAGGGRRRPLARALRAAFGAEGGWASPYVASHAQFLGVPRELLPSLFVACWTRRLAALLPTRADDDAHPVELATLDIERERRRLLGIWREAVDIADALADDTAARVHRVAVAAAEGQGAAPGGAGEPERRAPGIARRRPVARGLARWLRVPPAIAIVGPDGAGKTTLARMLEARGPIPLRYIYMGANVGSSNYALPTSRWAARLAARRRAKALHTGDPENPTGRGGTPAADRLVRFARLVNRLAEAAYRHAVAATFRLRGLGVVYDRHFALDYADPPTAGDTAAREPLDRRVYRWCMRKLLPAPSLIVVLDAPGELLHVRKGESTPAALEARRRALLAAAPSLAPCTVLDAARPLDEVYALLSGQLEVLFPRAVREAGAWGPSSGPSGSPPPRVARTVGREPLRVLAYHRVLDEQAAAAVSPSLVSATPGSFERQMRLLAREYDPVGLDAVLAALAGGQPLPRRPVLITFDDAYRDFIENAWPVLRQLGLPVALFVPTAYPGDRSREFWWDRLYRAVMQTTRPLLLLDEGRRFPLGTLTARRHAVREVQGLVKRLPHAEAMALVDRLCADLGESASAGSAVLTWDELRQLAAEGVTLAAHTRTHAALDRLSPEEVHAEVLGSVDDLQREIGHAPNAIAYPFGAHNDEVVRLVRDAGIELGATCLPGHESGPVDPLRLRRTVVTRRTTAAAFPLRLTRTGAWLDEQRLRLRRAFERRRPPARDVAPAAPSPVPSEPGGGRGPRVAYIVSRFPKVTETFVLFEMAALDGLGVDIRLYPLLRERQPVSHPEGEHWLRRARFHPFLSRDIVAANLHFLRHQPRAYLGAWWEALRGTFGSANFLVGALGIMPKAVRLAYEMRAQSVQHVHAHFATHPALAALVVHRLTGIPFSFTAHGSDLHVDRRMLDVKLAAARFAVTVSEYNREVMVRSCGAALRPKIHVVHCGTDPEVFSPGDGGAPAPDAANPAGGEDTASMSRPVRLICVASLEEVKGHRFLVEACAILAARNVDFECVLVGDGPLRRELRAQVAREGLEDRIRMIGPLPRAEVAQALRAADIAVLASHPTASGKREGIPVALMEAMAAGLPVIATRLSGIPELVADGHSGILVPPGDARALAVALEQLAADPELRRSMGEAGRKIVEESFDLRRSARMLRDLFAGSGSATPAAAAQPAPDAEGGRTAWPSTVEAQTST